MMWGNIEGNIGQRVGLAIRNVESGPTRIRLVTGNVELGLTRIRLATGLGISWGSSYNLHHCLPDTLLAILHMKASANGGQPLLINLLLHMYHLARSHSKFKAEMKFAFYSKFSTKL